MHQFDFATAQQIIFGNGSAARLPEITKQHRMHRLMVITGSSPERVQAVIDRLTGAGCVCELFTVDHEPSIARLQQALEQANSAKCDGVVAIGGGSVIDTGKAVAALMRNHGELFDYLEVIGQGRPLEHPSAPCIAVPTTAGTGSEVTRNAVLYSPEHQVKVSLRSVWMLPAAAIVDPELSCALPPKPTAWSGMDALTQLIEPYVSRKANAFTDALCLQAIPEAARALPRAFHNGGDLEARNAMALASLFGGLALANAGLGVVHGFAGPLGGMFDAPHGAICAALLPFGMEANIRHLRTNRDDAADMLLERYRRVACCLTGKPDAAPEDGVRFVQELNRELQIPGLSAFGMNNARLAKIVEKASRASSMKANPITLSTEELQQVYQSAL